MPEPNGDGVLAGAPQVGSDYLDGSMGRCEAADDPAVLRAVGGDRFPARPAHSVDSEL
jgi:hypothetical protein